MIHKQIDSSLCINQASLEECVGAPFTIFRINRFIIPNFFSYYVILKCMGNSDREIGTNNIQAAKIDTFNLLAIFANASFSQHNIRSPCVWVCVCVWAVWCQLNQIICIFWVFKLNLNHHLHIYNLPGCVLFWFYCSF